VEYRDILLVSNYLKTTERYAEYTSDNFFLKELVESLGSENESMRQILLAKGLLRNVDDRDKK
jgi:hypothetical protein